MEMRGVPPAPSTSPAPSPSPSPAPSTQAHAHAHACHRSLSLPSTRTITASLMGGKPVLVHVYDMVSVHLNWLLSFMGLGVFHTGVQIGQWEYLFSADGVFKTTPRNGGFGHFRESVDMGVYHGSAREFNATLQEIRERFAPGTYNIISHNCNHFSDALCVALLDRHIPNYANGAAARVGYSLSFANCTCMHVEDEILTSTFDDRFSEAFASGRETDSCASMDSPTLSAPRTKFSYTWACHSFAVTQTQEQRQERLEPAALLMHSTSLPLKSEE